MTRNTRFTIVGGFYREICRFPQSDEFWGSGGRAAAAIRELGIETLLLTAVDRKTEPILATIAKTLGFEYSRELVPETITFRYEHGLSTPIISPPLNVVRPINYEASADCVLQFGMLEANVSVHAHTVIYDPQDPFAPKHFSPEKKPSRLAYVVNSSEAKILGRNADEKAAASTIAEEAGAQVVVVKMGPRGALVLENHNGERVPAYETSNVWPIGSGDVFAAIFAENWGARGMPAMEAAQRASRATAEYVDNRALPISASVINGSAERPPLQLSYPHLNENEFHVYLAGPFFNMSQLWLIDEARAALRGLGLKVFSPLHDVGVGKSQDVAPKDIEALKNSRAVLAIIDGVDTGTVFEAGYARALDKPVVAFSQSTPEEPLKMISGTGCEVVPDFVSAIYRAAWRALR